MNQLSYNEILAFFEKRPNEYSLKGIAAIIYPGNSHFVDGLGEVSNVKSIFDADNDCNKILHFVEHNVYIKFDGWYSSYEGYNFNDVYEVEPFEETVINYKKVNN